MTRAQASTDRGRSKPAGWHSRRHETPEAQSAAREAYRTRAERRPSQYWDGEKWVKVTP